MRIVTGKPGNELLAETVEKIGARRSRRTAVRRSWSAENEQIKGVIELQDIIKTGIRERFERLRKMGVKTVMVTGDNPLTAKYIAEKAGVDDLHRRGQARGQDGVHQARAAAPASWSP